jgi:hypothetical protein
MPAAAFEMPDVDFKNIKIDVEDEEYVSKFMVKFTLTFEDSHAGQGGRSSPSNVVRGLMHKANKHPHFKPLGALDSEIALGFEQGYARMMRTFQKRSINWQTLYFIKRGIYWYPTPEFENMLCTQILIHILYHKDRRPDATASGLVAQMGGLIVE